VNLAPRFEEKCADFGEDAVNDSVREKVESQNLELRGRGSPRIPSPVYSAKFFFKIKPTSLLKTKERVRNRTKQTHQVVEKTSKYVKS
jgi:hypothetical protein